MTSILRLHKLGADFIKYTGKIRIWLLLDTLIPTSSNQIKITNKLTIKAFTTDFK